MRDFWWKDAIIYGVDVERFCDGDGDGVGDFKGLTSKLPYLTELGITCIWLLPFFPSTDRDNGYDITDYYRVDSKYGMFEDFLQFIRRAGEHGIRVVLDLVTHHTSNEHPWFQSARHDKQSPFRDYYVWTDHPPPVAPGKGTIFPGEENSVWTYDQIANAFYHHRFYHFQPGLNHQNPRVQEEIEKIIDFWMSFGISGFRIDAASHMIEQPLEPEGKADPSHAVLRHIYQHTTARKPDALLMGEVDEDPDQLKRFFDGEQLNMMFNFFLDNYLILALAEERAEPIERALHSLPKPPGNGQWANFLRNLDEADLERLKPEELEFVLKKFAPKEEMRIFGRGIRRRLAPMLDGDIRRLRLAYSLLFSLPGAPVICYGDEIGMGEDLSQQGRNAVRTPMQWTAGKNGGFSKAPNAQCVLAPVDDGPFGFKKVNVEAQRNDPESLLQFIQKLAQLRRSEIQIGEGNCHFLRSDSPHVLAHRYHSGDDALVVVHNLSGKTVPVTVELDAAVHFRLEPLLGGDLPPYDEGRLVLELEPYGFRWYGHPE
jgi:maltose alpha-D-glucosyltransferase/alpha-amylase